MTREDDIHANNNNIDESIVDYKLAIEILKCLDADIREETESSEYYFGCARRCTFRVEGLKSAKSMILKKFNITERISSESECSVIECERE